MYDWETMHSQNPPEQEQSYELDGIAALEQPALVQQEVEQSQHIDDIEKNSTPNSFDSIVYQLQQMQQNGETEQSPGTGPHEQYQDECMTYPSDIITRFSSLTLTPLGR